MDIVNSIIMGVIQGITEFLPVSSSGHLVLFQKFITGFAQEDLFLDIMLHIGTLLAVLIYCWQEVVMLFKALLHLHRPSKTTQEKGEKALFWSVIVASIPTAIIGFVIKYTLVGYFSNLLLLAGTFAFTTLLLLASKFIMGNLDYLPLPKAFIVGIAQGLAVLPGVSRSGSTIVIGNALGLKRNQAARFAFVLSIPSIIGAGFFTILDVEYMPEITGSLIIALACGMIAAAIIGYISLVLLARIIEKARLHYFAFYTGLVSIFCLIGWFVL